jgi:hypothetical protein
MRTNIHALSGIRTHGPSVQVIKAYPSNRATTGTDCVYVKKRKNMKNKEVKGERGEEG